MGASRTYARPSGCIIFEVEDAASEFLDCYKKKTEKTIINSSNMIIKKKQMECSYTWGSTYNHAQK